MMSRSSFRKRAFRVLAALAAPVLVISTLTAVVSSSPAQAAGTTVPEPDGWYSGDMHVHRSCGETAEALSSIKAKMEDQNLRFIALLADCGNGEVQNPITDLPLVDGQDASISTAGRTVHWDSEWHWDATYGQYDHQALGGHLVNLGETSAQQVWHEMPSEIIDLVHSQGGISGFAHLQYLPSGIPATVDDCCTPIEYPVEVALGSADFISEDVTNTGDTAIEAYYRLLNTGFRPGFAAGTDYPCGNSVIGSRLTYSNLGGDAVTYPNWIDAIKAGKTVISRNGHNEFLNLTVNGTAGPGDQVDLATAGSVPVSVTWTATADYSGVLQLVQNGQVIAARSATVTAGSPVTLTADVDFTKSGWVAARRMNPDGNDHQVHTAAAFVVVNGAPVRVSATDAQFYVDWMDNLLAQTSPGGDWNTYFPNELAAAQARYQQAKAVFQQRKAEAEGSLLTVSSRMPATGATDVAVTTKPIVTFSQPVAAASVTASSVSLKAGSTAVPATLSVSGSVVTVTPLSSLGYGTVYTVSVSTGVTDLAGNHLVAPVSWSFTTALGTFSAPMPTVSGTTPVVGQVLSVGVGSWSPVPDAFGYQWVRGSNEISGATSSSYTVQAGDVAATLSVRVTGSKSGYTSLTKTSAATTAVAEGTLMTGTPTIVGSPGVGVSLTADPGTWGPAPVSLAYQWLRDGSPVGGATASGYTVTSADLGSKLSVMVTGSKLGYTTASTTSAETVTIAAGTLTTATPTIDDMSPAFGQVLAADPGSWGPAPVVLSYQWLRDGHEISAATSNTYTVTAADIGAALSVRVTGRKASFTTASTTSSETAQVASADLSPAPIPTISGAPAIGQVLTADPGTWGPGTVALAYQWLRAGAEIAGATGQSYTVTAQDAGAALSVRVTGTKANYTSASRTSAATAAVPVPVLPPASPNPTITGVARVGMPLTASLGSWNPAPTKVTYQWYWLKNSGARVTIKKATKAGYTPTSSVQGRRLQVRIKASLTGGVATRYSTPTGKVAAPMKGRTPKISDTTPKVGQVLTAKPGSWKPTQTTFAYQWYAKRGSGKLTAIVGATTGTYQVEARYAGYRIKVKVIGAAPGYKPVTRTSGYTHKVHT